MSIRSVIFAMMGLIVSMGLFGSMMASDMREAKERRQAGAGAVAPTAEGQVPLASEPAIGSVGGQPSAQGAPPASAGSYEPPTSGAAPSYDPSGTTPTAAP